jgi:hypothetical protein
MSVTFAVDRVTRAKQTKFARISPVASIQKLTNIEVEACGTNSFTRNLIGPEVSAGVPIQNGFLRTIHAAYAEHYPLVLSPDDVWLAITQGFAAHVNAHSEELRHLFVAHEGQAVIEVHRDMFIKGRPDNDWPGVFSEFSEKIGQHIGEDKRSLLVSNFSLTGPVERAVSEIVLMDSMKNYFDYVVYTLCGIPEVTLLGSLDDWQNIQERVNALAEYKCVDWIAKLETALGHFTQAFAGNANPKFWGNFYKHHHGSGGPCATGNINVFFPYLKDPKTGEFTVPNKQMGDLNGWGNELNDFPAGLSKVPFTWIYYSREFPMDFLGGFIAASQDPTTLEVRPAMGWGVTDRIDPNRSSHTEDMSYR